MICHALSPNQSLNKAYRKEKVARKDIELFKSKLREFLESINEKESEEHVKNNVTKFLYETYYQGKNQINTKGRIDLAIYEDKKPVVIIEAKRPNSPDMVSSKNLNAKAMHELMLYYLRERIEEGNNDIKFLVATNMYEWFVFDALVFEKLFYKDHGLTKDFNDWKNGRKSGDTTDFFYTDIAFKFLKSLKEEITFTKFDLREIEKIAANKSNADDHKLIPVFKFLSPAHLLKQPFANDSNSLDTKFYSELLHIIGLEEKKDGGKKIIQRKEKPDPASLLENAIATLVSDDKLRKLPEGGKSFGATEDERLFNVALELCITWINRVLFLKLLEGQLLIYHGGDKAYRFLDFKNQSNFDQLNKLFFDVLAKVSDKRPEAIRKKYAHVPYLNSSLFDFTPLEEDSILIKSLDDSLRLKLASNTVLKSEGGKKRDGDMPTLQYLFEFLDAYDFASEGKEEIQEENKGLINASVLGLIFEKINGYKDGSFFTPGFITMYMCRETIRRAVVQKFNEAKGWKLDSFDQLYNEIKDIKEANAIINSLKICDPAVGSGHFLVSALNEIIAIKSELNILSDRSGKVLRGYSVEVINDELIISIDHSEFFEYKPGNKESQRVQEALFHERQTIIENCLFGVDINPNSVKICRLRLWIELLKNAYYTADSKYAELETLPNIDINIKQGNSLISRFSLDADLSKALKSIKYSIDDYRSFVNNYKNATDKEEKRGFEKLINQIKTDFRTEIGKNDPLLMKKNKLGGELYNLLNQASVFEPSEKEKKERNKRKESLEVAINKLSTEIDEIKSSAIYKDAFEWRFEFPEVIDREGNYLGFDVIIGNPPYISLQRMKGEAKAFESQNYFTYTKLGDIYCLFFEKGMNLLKKEGHLTFITSNSWLRTQYGKPLREFFKNKTNPVLLLNVEDTQLFEEATVESNILVIQNSIWSEHLRACSIGNDFNNSVSLEDYFNSHAIIISDLPPDGWNISGSDDSQLKIKIENDSIPLKDFGISIFRGVTTGCNEAFYIDGKKRKELISKSKANGDLIKPAIRGKDITKYGFQHDDLYVIFSRRGVDLSAYPEIKKHLDSYRKFLEPKPNGWSGNEWLGRKPGTYKWYEIQDNTAYFQEFEKDKIVWGELSDDSKFAFDNTKSYPNNTVFILTGKSIKYLLALLNSRLAKWYFNLIATSSGMGTNRWLKYKIEQLPVKDISDNKQMPFVNRVDEILKAKKNNPDSNTAALEKEIDNLVYQLYGLTEEEIKIVEGK
jgi:type II restriction/modification system DNA methylase subunit YeeA